MKTKMGYLVSCFFIVLVCACNDTRPSIKELLSDTGLFEQHLLHRIEQCSGRLTGSFDGSFFLAIGSIEGAVSSECSLRFYWSPKPNEIVATTLPYSKFRFIIDDTKNVPTAEFVFSDSWLHAHVLSDRISVSEKANINDFLMDRDYLMVVKVKISKKQLKKEIYLPK